MTPPAATSRALTARRLIPAPRADVFAAWTDPDAIVGWFGGRNAHTLTAAVDLRVGGAYRITVQAGDDVRAVEGLYREVEVPARLVFTWRWDVDISQESLVTVEFLELEAGTEVVVTHENLETIESLVFHQGGWCASLEELEEEIS